MNVFFGLFLYYTWAFGLAYVVGHSAISLPARAWLAGPADSPNRARLFLVELLECPACFGVWTGGAMGLLVPGTFGAQAWWLGAIVGAFSTAGVNLVLANAAGMKEDRTGDLLRQVLPFFVRALEGLQAKPEAAPVEAVGYVAPPETVDPAVAQVDEPAPVEKAGKKAGKKSKAEGVN